MKKWYLGAGLALVAIVGILGVKSILDRVEIFARCSDERSSEVEREIGGHLRKALGEIENIEIGESADTPYLYPGVCSMIDATYPDGSRVYVRIYSTKKQATRSLSAPSRDQAGAIDDGFTDVRPLDHQIAISEGRTAHCYQGTVEDCGWWSAFGLSQTYDLVGIRINGPSPASVDAALVDVLGAIDAAE